MCAWRCERAYISGNSKINGKSYIFAKHHLAERTKKERTESCVYVVYSSKCSSIEVTSCLSCRIHMRMLICVVGKCTWRIFLNYSQVQKEQRVKMAGPCIFSSSFLSISCSLSLSLSFSIYRFSLLLNIKFPLQRRIQAKRKSGNKILENILWWRLIVFQHVVTYNICYCHWQLISVNDS